MRHDMKLKARKHTCTWKSQGDLTINRNELKQQPVMTDQNNLGNVRIYFSQMEKQMCCNLKQTNLIYYPYLSISTAMDIFSNLMN
jgi:hypothetical protein